MVSDIRYALRQLLKSPGFTFVAVLTLALGIGACTAIFSVVDGVLLRPLAYPNPERIVVVKETILPEYPEFSASPPNFIDWTKQAKSFSHLAAITGAALNLTGSGEPQRLTGAKATAPLFDVYGLRPVAGRFFLPEEDAPGKDRVVVLSHSFWQRFFAGSASVIGRTLELNGEPYTVVGVAPAGFGQNSRLDAWVPMAFTPSETANSNRDSHYINVVGRLRPDVTVEQADAEMKVIAAQLAKQYPDSNKGWGAFVQQVQDYSVRGVRTVLYTLFGAVGCVLLIACANIANLLLARATSRYRELSIRAALGATGTRIMRQLLTESVVLALVGGVAGILLASWGLNVLLALVPDSLPNASGVSLDRTVLAFAVGLSLLTGLLFGLAPGWFALRVNVNDALKQGSRGSTDSGGRSRLRGALVAAEVAACVMLLAGAGLLLRSFQRLSAVDPGFNPQNATVVRLSLPEKKYPGSAPRNAFVNALLEKLRALPGVQAVGVANTLPLVGDWILSFEIEGQPPLSPTDQPSSNYYAVTPDYFAAMGVRVVRGRAFTPQDDAKAPRVAVVNETFARTFFPNADPIGKRINITNGPRSWREIVGIVADVTQYGPDRAVTAQMYEPYAQKPSDSISAVVRSSGSTAAITGLLRPTVYSVDPNQPIGSIQPLEDILAGSIARQRFTTLLLTIFSVIALFIAAIGIYGVMAYSVQQRTSEIGVRMALGAQPADVLRLILKSGGGMVGAGLLLGIGATLASGRMISSLLFQTSAFDPIALGGVVAILAVAAAIACFIPARRATKVDPIVALRNE